VVSFYKPVSLFVQESLVSASACGLVVPGSLGFPISVLLVGAGAKPV
jgi:hypothetical protein